MKKPESLLAIIFLSVFWSCFPLLSAQQMYLEENRACRYLEEGKIDDAILLLTNKLNRYPRNYDCHLYLGVAYYLRGDFDKSMETLNKVEFETERIEKARGTMQAGKRMEDFSQEDLYLAQRADIVFTKGRRGILKFALGMLYKKSGDYKNAQKRFNEALKYHYPQPEAGKQLVVVDCFLKDFREARKNLEEVFKTEAKSDALSFLDGYIAYYLNEEAKAIEIFSQISASMPDAKRNLATAYYNQGNYAKALEIWEDMLKLDPKDVDSLRNTGRAYFHLGQTEKGQEQFHKSGLEIKVEKYSPKTIPLTLIDLFPESSFHFQCDAT
jgi:tetratricopeptide (TPR) repeat protein